MQNLGTSRSRNIVVTTAYFSRWHIFFAEECEYASKNTIADDKDLNVETLLVINKFKPTRRQKDWN